MGRLFKLAVPRTMTEDKWTDTATGPKLLLGHNRMLLRDDVKQWLLENCHGHWQYDIEYGMGFLRFKIDRDAFLFKVTWL